uniref:PepX_C domain-containing protein n=1 Tax=Caenorhabditis tropicalis TaxID=1561998 RepID=A0A1I7U675_9PELO
MTSQNSYWAPMVQINVTALVQRNGGSRFHVAVDRAPYEFNDSVRVPTLHYEIVAKHLIPVNPGEGLVPAPGDDETLRIYSGSTQAWTRASPCPPLGCTCDRRYTQENRRHDDRTMCVVWTIGQEIAERFWTGQPIENMRLEFSN